MKFAPKVVPFLHITTHVDTDKDQDLFEEKGGDGFPFMVFLDGAGSVIAKMDRPYTVEVFEEALGKAGKYMDIVKKAEGGDKAAGLELVIAQLENGAIKLDEAKKKLATLPKPAGDAEKRLNSALANLEVEQVMEDQQTATAKKFIEMMKAKRVPTDKEVGQQFYIAILNYAEKQKDAASFEAALAGLKEMFGDNPNAKGFFDAKEKTLKKLKEGGDKK